MRPRSTLLRPALLLLLAGTVHALASGAARAQDYATPDWYVILGDAGYSDFIIYTSGAFPADYLHELISGEWGAGVGYDGIALPAPQRTMWLAPTWDYPAWDTNSTFEVVEPLSFPEDLDGDGLVEGRSIIANADLEVAIDYDFVDTVDGTPMGRGSGMAFPSNRYVLLVTYTLRNLRATPLTGVRIYQLLHGHPANSEEPVVEAFYDTTLHPGPFEEFRYDMTQRAVNSGAIDGSETGCMFEDFIGFSTEVAPGDFGLGTYRGHISRPATGLHVAVENDTLGNETAFGPDEVAGASRIDLGTLAAGASAGVRVLLSVRSADITANQVAAGVCVRAIETPDGLDLRVDKGACQGGAPASTPWDLLVGDLAALQDVGGTIVLGGSTCAGNDVAEDRMSLSTTLSDCRPGVFLLARRGGFLEFDWGGGSSGSRRFAGGSDCPLF